MTRIAIVEDKAVIRESLAAYVHTDPELRCVCARGSAEEALRELPKHQPEIVLMDIQLPRQSGIECTAQLKQLLPAIKIIMVTVYGEPERIFQALRAGACGYLLKRCKPEELVAAIREVREGGAPMSREIARHVIAYFQQTPAPPSAPGSWPNFHPGTGNSQARRARICRQGNRGKIGVRHAPCAGTCSTCMKTPCPLPHRSRRQAAR